MYLTDPKLFNNVYVLFSHFLHNLTSYSLNENDAQLNIFFVFLYVVFHI